MTAYQRRVEWYVEHGVERAVAEQIVKAELKAMGVADGE